MTIRTIPVKCNLLVLILFACTISNSAYAVNKDHIALIKKYSCALDESSAEFKLMNTFLVEKNKVKSLQIPIIFKRSAILVDYFVSPEYLKNYRLIPGSARFDSYTGSEPEKLICIGDRDGSRIARTELQYIGVNQWIKILEYSLVLENKQYYIRPIGQPISLPPSTMEFQSKLGDTTTFFLNPHKTIAEIGN